MKPINYEAGGRLVNDEREEEEVEEHVKGIQPEVLSELRLVLTPRTLHLESKEEERNTNEPIEVIPPAGIGDFSPQILCVAAVGFFDDC